MPTPVEQKHLKIDFEVNLAQELGNYGNVGGSADNFFNLDVNARQISLFSLRAAEVNKNTPLGRLQQGVVDRRYTYEKENKEQV